MRLRTRSGKAMLTVFSVVRNVLVFHARWLDGALTRLLMAFGT